MSSTISYSHKKAAVILIKNMINGGKCPSSMSNEEMTAYFTERITDFAYSFRCKVTDKKREAILHSVDTILSPLRIRLDRLTADGR